MEIEYDSQKQFDIYALVFYVVQCLIEVFLSIYVWTPSDFSQLRGFCS